MPLPIPPMKPHPSAAAAGRAVLVALSFALSAAALPAAAQSQPASAPAGSQAARFAEASQLFRAGRHAAAYGRFVRLANEGDREAASIALVMHRHGAVLFGSVWDATTEELEYWSLLAQSADRAEIEARVRVADPGGDHRQRTRRGRIPRARDLPQRPTQEALAAARAPRQTPRRGRGELALSSDTAADRRAPMQPVITSLLDTDLYKFTMWQAMLHRHPQTQAEYTFVCRNTPAYPLAELLTEVDRELDALCALSFRAERARLPRRAALHPLGLRRLPAHLPLPARLHHRPRRAPTARASRSSPAVRRCT